MDVEVYMLLLSGFACFIGSLVNLIYDFFCHLATSIKDQIWDIMG